MEFVIVTFGTLALLVLFVLVLGKWYPGSGAEVLDWKPTRSYEDEVRLELEDIDQMIEAQNERRRRTGRAEITEDQVRAEIAGAEREQRERAEEFRRSGDQPPGREAP
jgi:hypothetical protein